MANKLNQQDVINQFIQIHGNKYDYSLVKYVGDSFKIKIICPEHGIFEQQVACHKRQKQGCPQCGRIQVGDKQRISGKEFIVRINKIFGKNKFDFTKLEYKGAHVPITLICKKCNNIETKAPSVWYKGYGCLKCIGNHVGKKRHTTIQFIEKAKTIHGDKYDYSKVKYVTTNDKVEIICPKHGSFFQIANVHINSKSGCPNCKGSKGEEQVAIWLNEHNIEYIFQHKVELNKSKHYFDFYIPSKNLIIEFNGLQHYKSIKFFGGEEGFEYLKKRDKIKEKYCLKEGIQLLKIHYKDIIKIDKILNEKIFI